MTVVSPQNQSIEILTIRIMSLRHLVVVVVQTFLHLVVIRFLKITQLAW